LNQLTAKWPPSKQIFELRDFSLKQKIKTDKRYYLQQMMPFLIDSKTDMKIFSGTGGDHLKR